MSKNDAIESFKIEELENLVYALKIAKPPVARVGILGDSNARQAGEKAQPTNAEIGAAHEFGTEHIPQRSFLRVPIAENLNKEMERSGLFDYDVLHRVIKESSLVAWLEKMCICAEAVVKDAFDTGGNGKWPAWKKSTYSNNAGQLLVDTKQLRESITSEVKK